MIKHKSFHLDTKEESCTHVVLKIKQRLPSFTLCKVKRNGNNLESTLFNSQAQPPWRDSILTVVLELILRPFSIVQQNPQGSRQPNGEKGKTPPAALPTAVPATTPTVQAARRRHQPPT